MTSVPMTSVAAGLGACLLTEDMPRLISAINNAYEAGRRDALNARLPTVRSLEWSDPQPPSETLRYDHFKAESGLGVFTIEWKSWKTNDPFCLYLDGEYLLTANTIDEAKECAQSYLRNVARNVLAPIARPPGYLHGMLLGERVTLTFESQEHADEWFEGFMDVYDAAGEPPPAAPAPDQPYPIAPEVVHIGQPLVVGVDLARSPDHSARWSPHCWCSTCRPITPSDSRMVLCPTCGNKRCPHAAHHANPCSGSNEPGQPGSNYPAPSEPKDQDQ